MIVKMRTLFRLLLQTSSEKAFSNDPVALGRFFYAASCDPETAGLLGSVIFSTTSGYPRSRELDDAIRRLQTTGAIGRDNPSYARNAIGIGPADESELKALSQRETEQFNKLRERFANELCIRTQ